MIRRKGIRWEYNGDGRFSAERIDRFWKRYWRRWARRCASRAVRCYEETR